MTDTSSTATAIDGYHAHVYYDTETKPVAKRLAEQIRDKFSVKFGGFHDGPIGPHPIANLQIIFTAGELQNVVPWLMLNREGLDILIHPLTDNSVDDHSRYALWFGNPVQLRLETLRPAYRSELLPAG